ncbi:MAG: Tm-1-like ATP-binding domain-containing protein, partial [Desulfobacteraceae bacterium]
CSVNHMTPAKRKYKPEYAERRKYDLDKHRTWIRHSPDELIEVAGEFAKKLNKATGPVKMVIPVKGWSSVDAPGNATHDPEEDSAFVQELSKLLNPGIPVLEVDANMEEPAFAKAVVKATLEVLRES